MADDDSDFDATGERDGEATRELPVRPRRGAGEPAAVDETGATITRAPGGRGAAAPPATTTPSAVASSPSTGPPAVAAALHAEEVARMRGWSLAVMLLATSALAFTPGLPGTTESKGIFAGAIVVLFVTALWTWLRCRDEKGYTPLVFRVFAWVAAIVSFELVYFLGVFSPTPVVITLGVTFIGLGRDRRTAVVVPIVAVAGYAVMAGLITAGVLEDRGVIRAPDLTMMPKLFGAVMVPVVLLMTLGLARLSRRTLEEAANRSHEALRLANQREAQLAEANQEVEAALRAGQGQQGRWTGAHAGAWELAEVIGRGAMGEIYAARQRDTGDRAAVKLLREDVVRDEKLVERFVREGQIASALDVPNVVRMYETGRIDGRVPYMAMELLTGEDLARLLRRTRTLEKAALVELARHVARGLDAAHAAGIVHRDLKPQNLFRSGDARAGTWKILDFGVSTLIGSTGTLTQAAVVGTPGYMSPEQARSLPVDRRCDVFAFGAVIYRALAGRPPFSGADTPQILFDVVYRMPIRPGELVDGAGADVDAVLAIALAKRVEDRFSSAGELASALEAALSGVLDRDLRRRGDALIGRHPWGKSLAP
ncbi:MAG TPA: serine/threonine-protein kinase [Kofleriaceae bacterium]|nr:serine/threonine-protein kinase [Kofleriaceae bacterium]